MRAPHSSLTGSWSGAYRFPGDTRLETVFNVQIEEVGGAFTGALQEPNVYGYAPGQVITADIEGVRTDQSVVFTKFYNGSGGMNHAVRYEGTANANLSRIDGKWTIPRDWSGTFFMVREDDGEAVEAEEVVEEEVRR